MFPTVPLILGLLSSVSRLVVSPESELTPGSPVQQLLLTHGLGP